MVIADFSQTVFPATSEAKVWPDRLADRAGIPKANAHYYFKSKTNLYVAALDNIINLWNDLLGEITVDHDSAEVLDRFIRKKVEPSYTHPRASKLSPETSS